MLRFVAVAFFLMLLTGSAFADTPVVGVGVQCGMEESPDGTLKVKAADPSICEDDVAFAALYMMFSDIFMDSAVKPFALWFVDEAVMDSEFIQFVDETLPISNNIYSILTATALVSWSVMGIVLVIKSLGYAWQFLRTGKKPFSQSTGDDGMKMIVYLAILIFLSMPVGFSGGKNGDRPPIMTGQAAAVLLSLPALNVGNMGYSTYLSATQMASSDTGVNEDALLLESQPVANALISTQICQVNTALATFNMQSTAESGYFADTFYGVGDFGYDALDQEHILETFDECTGYNADAEAGEVNDTVSSVMVNKSKYDQHYCQASSYTYETDTFGYDHNCGTISYNLGEGKFSSILSSEHSELGEDNEDLLETLQDSIDGASLFRIFRADLLEKVRIILRRNGYSPQERLDEIEALIMSNTSDLIARGLNNDMLRVGTVEERQLFHLYAGVAMLGGEVRNYGDLENKFSDAFAWMEERERYPSIHYPDPSDGIFWFEELNFEARRIAELIRQYHCAVNWADHSDARQFIAAFNRSTDSEQIRRMFDSGKVPFQCVRLIKKERWDIDDDFNRYMTYHLDDGRAFSDLKQDASGAWRFNVDDREGIANTAEIMRGEVADEIQVDIKARQLILAGYIAAVKKVISDSLEASASDVELDSIRDVSLRGMGWGVLGGALLYTGQTQSSSMHMGSSFKNIMSVGAGEIDDNGVNMDAFGPDVTEDQISILNSRFKSLGTERFLAVGTETAALRSTFRNTEAASEEEAMQQLFRYMEYLFVGPISHIKGASGMPVDRSLGDGLRFCFENGADSCLSGGKHPITALSHFGNEMLNNGLVLMTGLLIVDKLFGSSDLKVEKATMGGEKSGAKSLLKQSLKFLVKIVGAAVTLLLEIIIVVIEVVLFLKPILMPIAIGMIVIGFVFAFLLPMLSFLYGFMVLLLMVVGVFLSAAVIPFYLLYKLLNLDKEYSNGIQLLYRDFFGVYLTPILYVVSAVVAWSLMVVGLYLFNFSYSILHEGLGASYAGQNGTVMGFVFNVILYMLYFFGLFVYLRFLMQLMKSLTDKAKEKLNLAPSNDGQFMDSLGFENYIQARVVGDMAKGLSKISSSMRREQAKNMGFGSYQEMLGFRDQLKEMVEQNRTVMSGGTIDPMAQGGRASPSSTSQSNDVKSAPESGENALRQDEVPLDQKGKGHSSDDVDGGSDDGVEYSSGENPDGKPETTHKNPQDAIKKSESDFDGKGGSDGDSDDKK